MNLAYLLNLFEKMRRLQRYYSMTHPISNGIQWEILKFRCTSYIERTLFVQHDNIDILRIVYTQRGIVIIRPWVNALHRTNVLSIKIVIKCRAETLFIFGMFES